MLNDQVNWLCCRCGETYRMAFKYQQLHSTGTFILLFCSRLIVYFSFFRWKDLASTAGSSGFGKFSKPSLVKFSWFALRVVKVRLLLLISAVLVHDFSTLFWHTTIGTKSKVSRIKPIIRMAVFKNKFS